MPGAGAAPAPGEDDALAALERLQSLGTPSEAAAPPRAPRQSSPPQRPRPRPATRSGALPVARIVAPVVFLVAVVVLVSLLFQSGVIGGRDQAPVTTPTPTATKTKAGSKSGAKVTTTKVYVVKAGDTPSGIAAKYSITLAELRALNPGKDLTTVVIGEKLKVPKK